MGKVTNYSNNMNDYILFFLSKRKIIVGISALFFLLGILIALLLPKWYKATVKILPPQTSSGSILDKISDIAGIAGNFLPVMRNEQYYLYSDILTSNMILEKVLSHQFNTSKYKGPFTLYDFWETEFDTTKANWQHERLEKAKKKLREQYIDVSYDRTNDIMQIDVFVPEDPELAAQLANYLVSLLDDFVKHFRKSKIKESKIFIEKRLHESELELEKARKDLQTFLELNKNLEIPAIKMEYKKLQMNYEVQKAVYIELKKQLEVTKIEEVKENELIDVLEYATVPVEKFKPKRVIVVLSITIFGFFLTLIFLLFKEYLIKLRKYSVQTNN